MAKTTMRDVVRRLCAEGSEVMRELVEFELSLADIQQSLSMLEAASRALNIATRHFMSDDDDGVRALREYTGRLHLQASQLRSAFDVVCDAVGDWSIAEASVRSKPPGDGNSSPVNGS